jgi:GT2 family glycosyltransferase
MLGAHGQQDATRPEVDVVILTWNDGDLLATAINSVVRSEDVTATVIVVDNGSDPPALVTQSGVELVRSETNLGVAPGRNRGAEHGSAPFLCLLDSDAELAGSSLRTLLDALTDPTVGVAVPVFRDQAPEASGGRAPSFGVKLSRGLGLRSTYDSVPRDGATRVWDVEFGIGACQVIRRSVFDEVGGLDGSIFYGPEDVDFCLRVKAAGHRVVQVAGADVLHPPRRAFRQPFTARGMRHGWAIVRHLWRHRGSSSPPS